MGSIYHHSTVCCAGLGVWLWGVNQHLDAKYQFCMTIINPLHVSWLNEVKDYAFAHLTWASISVCPCMLEKYTTLLHLLYVQYNDLAVRRSFTLVCLWEYFLLSML